jgi:hypothetical protein
MEPVARMMHSPQCINAYRSCCSRRVYQVEIRYISPGYIPLIAIPSRTRNTIISCHECIKAVHKVTGPTQNVTVAKNTRGPTTRTGIVEGSWNTILLTVKMNMAMEKRLPVRSRSFGIEVTEADEIMPLSRRLRLHRRPAIEQSCRFTLSLRRLSTSLLVASKGSSFGVVFKSLVKLAPVPIEIVIVISSWEICMATNSLRYQCPKAIDQTPSTLYGGLARLKNTLTSRVTMDVC